MNRLVLPTIFSVMIAVSSCTHLGKGEGDFQRRNLDEYYTTSGVIVYFLPELPEWANTSASGDCKKKFSTRFLDYSKIMKSYNLTYAQAVHFQHIYNVYYRQMKKSSVGLYVPMKEEEELFYRVLDQIQADHLIFLRPSFKRIHLVWIDSFFKRKDGAERLKKLFSQKDFEQGFPVAVSLCQSEEELLLSVKMLNLTETGVSTIGQEFLSPFDQSGAIVNSLILKIDELFGADQQLYMYTYKENLPPEYRGNLKNIVIR